MENRGLESPDEIRKHIGRIQIRLQTAEEEASKSVNQIINTEEYSSDQAIQLAGNYVTYTHEVGLNMQAIDDAQIRLKEDPNQEQFEEGYQWKKYTLREAEVALFDASRGNFIALRKLLRDQAVFQSQLKVSDDMKPAHKRRLRSINRLANALPDEGKPFISPPPAYLQREKEQKKDMPITFKNK